MKAEKATARRRRSFSLGLRARLIGLILLAVIPAFGLAIYTSNNQRNRARDDAQAAVQRDAAIVANQQQDLLTTTRSIMGALSNLPILNSPSPSECNNFLASLFRSGTNYSAITVLDPQGNALCGAYEQQLGQNYANNAWFAQAIASMNFTSGGYTFEKLTGKPVLTVAYPIQDRSGHIARVLTADLTLNWVQGDIQSDGLSDRGTLAILDSTGTQLANYSNQVEAIDRTPDPRIKDIALQRKAAGSLESQGRDSVNRLYGFAMMPGSQPGHEAYVIAGYPSSAAYAESNRILRYSLVSLAVVAALAASIAWFGRDLFVLQHMKALYAMATRLRGGNFSARTGVPYTRDEVGLLARTIDEMAGALDDALAQRDVFESSLERANGELLQQAATDLVTGALSRREIYRRLETALEHASTEKRHLTVCMADIDHFKLVNDHHGHLTGDEVLKRAADALAVGGAIVGRFGGDEFLVILPGAGDHEVYASLVRSRMGDSAVHLGVSLSASLGFAFFPGDGRAIDGLIKAADEDMYAQKFQKRSAA